MTSSYARDRDDVVFLQEHYSTPRISIDHKGRSHTGKGSATYTPRSSAALEYS